MVHVDQGTCSGYPCPLCGSIDYFCGTGCTDKKISFYSTKEEAETKDEIHKLELRLSELKGDGIPF